MERLSEDSYSWLFGLRSYFMFVNDTSKLRIIRNLIALRFGKEEDIHHIIRRVCLEDVEFYTEDHQVAHRAERFEMYFNFLSKNTDILSVERVLYLMKLLFKNGSILIPLYDLVKTYQLDESIKDAFSKGQVTSKVWLIETMQKLVTPGTRYNNIVIIGGWYGHLTHYLKDKIEYDNFYNIDPHEFNSYIGRENFNHGNKKYHVSSATIESVNYAQGAGYQIPIGDYDTAQNFKFTITDHKTVNPDLVINTSCEHMNDNWYNQLPSGKLIALQTNNLRNIAPDHFNCIDSISDMDTKYPMSKVLFQGELDITVGKRFMKIGIK
jgi:hypothetical protein